VALRLVIIAAALVGAGLAGGLPPAEGACPHPYPGGVIECLQAAYAARDTALYAAVLAPDFRFTGADSGAGLSRGEDLSGTATLFASADSIAFEITGPITVLDGPAPGIFILDRVATALTVIIDKPDGKSGWRSEELSSFTVREVEGPEPGYEIVEWRQLQGE
jgi:hypothetical protein